METTRDESEREREPAKVSRYYKFWQNYSATSLIGTLTREKILGMQECYFYGEKRKCPHESYLQM